jgi:hypothetical protein
MMDNTTHKYWWTWIPALPLSRDDHWYAVLKEVFADHTLNCRKLQNVGPWKGAYTEGHEDHQTIGVFHSFSALPNDTSPVGWVEALLRECGIDL